ncbi:MAG: hypothetical protein QOE31_171 [Solirubrobacteraceae bacterium]|nr:hypothetical protein [Solirubrobacteraceae bacterium]
MRSVAALAVALVALLGACPPATGAADGLAAQFFPQPRPDARDTPGSPLDVRRVAFGQRDAHLWLDLRTAGAWTAHDLVAPGRALCLVLRRGAPSRPAGRLCVGSSSSHAVLRYERIDRHGHAGARRRIAADVSRPDERSLHATFAASDVRLPIGSLAWALESRWRDGVACVAGCADRVPDSAAFTGVVTTLAQPPCFAAAARDPAHPCHNAALRDTLSPSPSDAVLLPNSPCRVANDRPRHAILRPCDFGVTSDRRRATFALIGDSHAATWRPALEVVAQARRWRGVSITRAGCPFSAQIPASPDLGPVDCARLHSETLAWLRMHREVHTIFVSSWAQPTSGPHGGTGGYGGGAAAFGAMLDTVPRSVRDIYVLRDNPGTAPGTPGCVQAARARRARLAGACAAARSAVLTADPAVAAAASRRPRVHVIDLTRFFCDRTRCFPVIGGAYVYKDDNHMNAVFATSLGPFVLRALAR